MKKTVRGTAKKFKNAMYGEITLVNAVKYAERIGYDVIFFNSLDNEYLITYDLLEAAQKTPSFTYVNLAHVIFVDDRLSHSKKLHRLLHEIGHILLGHIGNGNIHLLNTDETESEAEAFVCEVLYSKRKYNIHFVFALVLTVSLFLGVFLGYNIHTKNIDMNDAPAVSNDNDIVYITASGTKFHRADCFYIKNKNCSTLKRAEAEKKYSPCAVCKP